MVSTFPLSLPHVQTPSLPDHHYTNLNVSYIGQLLYVGPSLPGTISLLYLGLISLELVALVACSKYD
jgi:hypothetical protein